MVINERASSMVGVLFFLAVMMRRLSALPAALGSCREFRSGRRRRGLLSSLTWDSHQQTVCSVALFDPPDAAQRIKQPEDERSRQPGPPGDRTQRQSALSGVEGSKHARTADNRLDEVRIALDAITIDLRRS